LTAASDTKQIRLSGTCGKDTQTEFAALLNVPKVTAVSWENGTRKPSGTALRLLTVAKHHPDALQAA
jgi:DNA-binding transcriptional regulator YiaG